MSRIHLTPAMQLIIGALVSLIGGALMAGFAAIWQYYSQHNDASVLMLIGVGCATALAIFSKSLIDYVPAHVQEEMAALRDAFAQLQDTHSTTVQALNRALTPVDPQPPVAPSPSPYVTVPLPAHVDELPTAKIEVPSGT